VLAAALVSSLALALGGCMSAPQSSASAPMAATQALASAAGFVYSANEGEDSISRIDLATRRVTTLKIPVTPHNVQISHDGRRLLAVGSMAGQMKKDVPHAAPEGARTRCREGSQRASDLRCDRRECHKGHARNRRPRSGACGGRFAR
jgi:hypothetical protein